MPTATQTDFSATATWQNLVASNPSTASVNLVIQNKGEDAIQVVFGGAQPTSQDAGLFLAPFDSVQGSAAAIWLRAPGPGGDKVGVTLL